MIMTIVGLLGAFILGLGTGLYVCIQTEVNKIIKQAAKEAAHGYLERESQRHHSQES